MKEKYRDYIKSSDNFKNILAKFNGFSFEDRTAIEKIKINRKLFAFDNSVNMDDVYYMLVNFDKYLWSPITVNKDYYLLDGQHRLALAKQLGLRYIDVMIEDKNKMEYSKESVKFKKTDLILNPDIYLFLTKNLKLILIK